MSTAPIFWAICFYPPSPDGREYRVVSTRYPNQAAAEEHKSKTRRHSLCVIPYTQDELRGGLIIK